VSIIRALGIDHRRYESLLHFFRAKSWTLSAIREKWSKIVARSGLVYHVNGKAILIGDGVKQSKEGRKMPCVKRLFQESENSAKPEYIFGHMFGGIGILIGGIKQLFCTPVSMTLQDGNEVIEQWEGDPHAKESHVERLVREACLIASYIKEPVLLLLDRYFLTVPALKSCLENQKEHGSSVTIITKAKSHYTAYEYPEPSNPDKPKRGAPRKKGKAVKLQTLFKSEAENFTKAVLTLYDKETVVSYLCKDLLWGQKLYQPLRFVLVNLGGIESILACTDLTMPAEKIIELYCLRFKIETCFRAFKQTIAGFAYHFWSASMPKLNLFKKNAAARQELESVENEKQRTAIISAVKAIEGFVMCCCIAQGLLQMSALKFAGKMDIGLLRWLRTNNNKLVPSEATIAEFLRKTIFSRVHFAENLPIFHLIRSVQEANLANEDRGAS
jgi:hypothetical protein